MKHRVNQQNTAIVFHPSMFDNRTGSIRIEDSRELFLENRLKDFFTVLLNHRNSVVTREELMSFVWKDIVVSEESISKAVSDLRKFFQTHNIGNIKIITISKVGYKLEISEEGQQLKRQSNYVKIALKILGFTILIVFFLIMLIRSLRYDQ